MDLSSSNSSVKKSVKFDLEVQERTFRSERYFPSTSFKRPLCRFFNTYGHCKYGPNCHFVHSRPRYNQNFENRRKPFRKYTKDNAVQLDNKTRSQNLSSHERVVCRFFKESDCRKSSHFVLQENASHLSDTITFTCQELDEQKDLSTLPDDDELVIKDDKKIPQSQNGISPRLTSSNAASSLRKLEIQLLKKRYPHCEHLEENECDIFKFTFSSSDPDWAFSVKFIQLKITLKNTYPEEVCDIVVLDEEEEIPPLLLKYLNKSIKLWLEEKHKSHVESGNYELILRLFFKWLDRNLEELFIEGLRKVKREIEAQKAGFEFIPYELLPGANIKSEKCDESDEQKSIPYQLLPDTSTKNDKSIESSDKENIDYPNSDPTSQISNKSETNISSNDSKSNIYNVPKRGTEIKLIGLELTEGTASMECKTISIVLNCSRCKTPKEVTTVPKQCYSHSCVKCNRGLQLTFQPTLMHQHSNVLGYLHLFDCQVMDLILPQSSFSVDCLNCNKRNTVDGIHYGQMSSTWCLFCNQKLTFIVQSCKFHQLQPPLRTGKVSVISPEKKAKTKDIAIEHGKPLPKDGTCVHYKKSHRWLRFPCCGKLYPCDECHNEAETDHEIKFASRMVCGFCSKEQPYNNDKPCIACSSFLTKKSGKHWEGGKGCRDKIRMSRNDNQKYAGTGKTISRKAMQQKTTKKKI